MMDPIQKHDQPGYDVIGDIHGQAIRLEALLAAMSYVKRDGVWMHPTRTAAFVGDFVDRGPENLRACRLVMSMTESRSAVAVMGNHDFNTVCLATPDPDQPGAFLRAHTEKNLQQADATLAEMQRSPEEATAVLAWLRALPLWMDRSELGIVHASWNPSAMAALAPFLDARGALTDEGFFRAARKGDLVRRAREMIINGPEADLPTGVSYRDPDGYVRTKVRLAWWKANEGLTLRDAIVAEDSVRRDMPSTPLPVGLLDAYTAEKPILFGHYWMRAPLVLQSPMHACVDASVAKGGCLAAYRFSGEATLDPERFLYV
jgi:hypothetical protein